MPMVNSGRGDGGCAGANRASDEPSGWRAASSGGMTLDGGARLGQDRAMSTPPFEEDMNPPEQARVIVVGEPVDGVDPLFLGSFDACLEEVWAQEPDARSELCIWTDARVYSASEIEALRVESTPR
jgi:hypothetical protein